jgi:hypothetical protein
MRVAVTGATGGALVGELRSRGDEPVAPSRDAVRAEEQLGVEAYEWKAPKSAGPSRAWRRLGRMTGGERG